MDTSSRRHWLWAVLLVGVVYLIVGIAFGALAGRAESNQMRVTWRLAAWVVSAVAFAAHVGYEHLRLDNGPRTTAFHAALAVAVGAFALAVAANLHASAVASYRYTHALALVLWPVLTALPAFVVALAAAAALATIRRTVRRP